MKLLISACLLGTPCRYDGKSKPNDGLLSLKERHTLFFVCPEVDGGLSTPRPPAERQGAYVRTRDGTDVTACYMRGAQHALMLAKREGISLAILKERSPSCGTDTVYDGSFSGTLTKGDGVTAELLRQNGVEVIGETEALRRIESGRL